MTEEVGQHSHNFSHGSLFNGVGGFQLAANWMGWENIMSCEIDPFCNRVTKYHFPNCIQHEDIRTTDFTIYRGSIDILTGGFPCQPFSVAGQRKGTEDDRHLWPEMLRAIREIQPKWVVGENVRGIVNWNEGLVFDQVCADLEDKGYKVQPYILPACGVNAPHRRERVWFVAYSSNIRCNNGSNYREERYFQGNERFTKENKSEWQGRQRRFGEASSNVTDANINIGCKGRMYSTESEEAERYTSPLNSRYNRTDWQDFPTKSPVCGRDDGIPRELDAITFPKWRNESIKAYGNAIVPQVAYQIFKAISQYE